METTGVIAVCVVAGAGCAVPPGLVGGVMRVTLRVHTMWATCPACPMIVYVLNCSHRRRIVTQSPTGITFP
jgi:hypothetical protein